MSKENSVEANPNLVSNNYLRRREGEFDQQSRNKTPKRTRSE
jgi:hypothetical protein